jgi:hypothetical protein
LGKGGGRKGGKEGNGTKVPGGRRAKEHQPKPVFGFVFALGAEEKCKMGKIKIFN